MSIDLEDLFQQSSIQPGALDLDAVTSGVTRRRVRHHLGRGIGGAALVAAALFSLQPSSAPAPWVDDLEETEAELPQDPPAPSMAEEEPQDGPEQTAVLSAGSGSEGRPDRVAGSDGDGPEARPTSSERAADVGLARWSFRDDDGDWADASGYLAETRKPAWLHTADVGWQAQLRAGASVTRPNVDWTWLQSPPVALARRVHQVRLVLEVEPGPAFSQVSYMQARVNDSAYVRWEPRELVDGRVDAVVDCRDNGSSSCSDVNVELWLAQAYRTTEPEGTSTLTVVSITVDVVEFAGR